MTLPAPETPLIAAQPLWTKTWAVYLELRSMHMLLLEFSQ
ncbi:hypothetical protein J2X15_002211 [Rhodoferax saidenbachensis]|uniref:Uncharacterized protein n=1 Tax=Rhodoferax saidenbachensis TaxID=1484693 RepID=A0ABU1ZPW4_9BURK|nr:hypothetical protein [Rhodoferax saidenbachensis]